jgi:aminoglycoside phosphotransferase (APT) family kinase protein
MHEDEVLVDDALVRALLEDQFPDLAHRRLMRIPNSGTDNAIFRLGDDLGLRLPRIHWAEGQIKKECRWLARLGPSLPAPVPVPLGQGRPGHGYPYPWLIYPWLEGTSLDRAAVGNSDVFAEDVAQFVLALEQIPTDGGSRTKASECSDGSVRRGRAVGNLPA